MRHQQLLHGFRVSRGSPPDIHVASALGVLPSQTPQLKAQCAARAGRYFEVDGVRVKAYRGMGSLEAMAKGSESRYHSDTQTLKIAQGVAGTVRDKGFVRRAHPAAAACACHCKESRSTLKVVAGRPANGKYQCTNGAWHRRLRRHRGCVSSCSLLRRSPF